MAEYSYSVTYNYSATIATTATTGTSNWYIYNAYCDGTNFYSMNYELGTFSTDNTVLCTRAVPASSRETRSEPVVEPVQSAGSLEDPSTLAEELLLSCLNDVQKKSLEENGYFELISKNGNIYRIWRGRSNNVIKMEEGKCVTRLCAHPREYVPNSDTMLAQALMLQYAEEQFLSIANQTPIL